MLYSREWLSQYLELPESSAEIAERLTSIGFAVETMDESGDDVVFDLEVNPNRPDCMNHLGMARELAAATGVSLVRPAIDWSPDVEDRSSPDATIEIDDFVDCPRYVAIAVRDVKIEPSPRWLRKRLEAVGVRPINNVVDITNFVLWEYGQPLHAFDLDRLASPTVIVRRAQKGERLVTLDGEDRELDSEVLVIADGRGAIALAGVMGGNSTEVGESTTNVLIESAHFAPKVVRKGAGKLGLHTDASHRFERGSDPEICLEAARRAATLMAELGGGKLPASVVDCRGGEAWEARGSIDLELLSDFVGESIPGELIKATFPALGFGLESGSEGVWEVTVPSWRRFDLEVDGKGRVYPAHLYEEALRFFGYDRVRATLPAVGGPDAGSSASHELREMLRGFLSATGLAETITYGFYGREAIGRFQGLGPAEEPLRVSNALSEQYCLMRQSLLPNLVDGARFNQNRGASSVRLYEIGHSFPGGACDEVEALGIVMGGVTGTPWSRSVEIDFFDLKGVIEGLAESVGVELEFEAADLSGLVLGTGCVVRLAGDRETCGYLGQVDEPEVPFALYAAELDASVLARRGVIAVETPSRYPGVAVDLTFTHPLSVEWREIERSILEAKPEDLVSFGLKDRYSGKGVPSGAVNSTLFFQYNSMERSLTKEEVNDRHERLATALRERFGTEE